MDIDLCFDSIFDMFEPPKLFCGELSCAESNAKDARDYHKVITHVIQFSGYALESANPHWVRALNLSDCSMERMEPRLLQQLASCLPKFACLRKLSMNGCGLGHEASRAVLEALCTMPQCQVANGSRVEIGLCDNMISPQTFEALERVLPKGLCMRGVGKILLNNNPIDDDTMERISRTFPCLQSLHVAGSAVKGANLDDVLRALPELVILGMDRTRLCVAAPRNILLALTRRSKAASPVGMETWVRGMDVNDDGWCELFAFVAKPGNNRFVLKHDLLAGFGCRPRHVSLVHDVVKVHLLIHGIPAIVVEHERVLSTKPVLQMANEVINELNLVCMGDESDARDRLIMKRRIMYRAALGALFEEGKIAGKRYKLGVVELLCVNPYTGEKIANYTVDHALMGIPASFGGLRLVVEAEERV